MPTDPLCPCATHLTYFLGGLQDGDVGRVGALADQGVKRGRLETLSSLAHQDARFPSPWALTSECRRYTTRPRPSRQTRTVYSQSHNSPLESKANHCWSVSSWIFYPPALQQQLWAFTCSDS